MGHIWTKIFGHKDVKILLLGLDAVGKTTLLYRLKLGTLVSHIPTIGFNVESIQHKDMAFHAWDIGSRDKIFEVEEYSSKVQLYMFVVKGRKHQERRPLFRHYYKGSDAVVIVIDSTDSQRLDELDYDVLRPALNSEELSNAVFLFLANKCDMEDRLSLEEITDQLNLKSVKQTWNLMSCSALTGEGIMEAMDWLAMQLGSVQAKRAINAPIAQQPDQPGESTSEKGEHRLDYCTRAYSAIKCLFFRPHSYRPDNPDSTVE